MRSLLSWDVTQSSLVIGYRLFLDCWTLERGCPETSVISYQSTLRNITEESFDHKVAHYFSSRAVNRRLVD